jgi:hypothetical protein
MRFKNLAATLIALAAFTVIATPAGAVVTNTASGRASYMPLNEAARAHNGAPVHATEPFGFPPLEYNGGPVMHSQTAYAIFWAPSGHPFPVGYESAITGYLENVAADSGKPTNVYSVSAQYTDGTGHAAYSDSFGGSLVDTTAYPTTGTCAEYEGFTSIEYTSCISDEKLEDEVEADVAAKGWTTGLTAEYYVVLPPEVGSCFEGGPEPVCFDAENAHHEGFCAYHSFSEPVKLIYANISYSPGDVFGCGVGEYPNGHSNGNVDDTLSSLSHEANESITDPLLNAWFDEEGFENGDECRNTGEDYGSALGGTSGSLFNQVIGSGHYYLQQEWSNDTFDCAQRVDLPTPVIADPGQVLSGHSVPFDGSGSVPGSGGIESYEWDFGDGGTASGESPSHTFASSGEFTVTLTLEDDGGFTESTTRHVSVSTPHSLAVSIGGAGSGEVSGTGISCPGACAGEYPSGASVVLTAKPSAGSAFGGWSGGGCSGTGICEVTMSSDQTVTAVFAVLPKSAEGGAILTPVVATPQVPIAKTALKCRKGFRKAKKHGKTVCAKVKHRHGKHR